MNRIIRTAVLALVASCQKAPPRTATIPTDAKVEPVKPAPKPSATVELAVSKDGERLGTIRIVAGEVGTLESTGAIAAKELMDLWREITTGEKDIRVHMHLPTEDGSRGPYGARIFRPTDEDYAGGVHWWLQYEKDFEVEVIDPKKAS